MKQFYIKVLSVFLFTFFVVSESNATHLMGADLTYECIGANTYEVHLTLYRDCNGITLPGTSSITANSVSCGANLAVNLTLTSQADITPVCPTEPTGCGSNGPYGIEEYQYTGTLTLPPGCGNDWVLSWQLCCRNGAINTLTNPDTQGMYVESTLDNTISPVCNNSPQFGNAPATIVCINQPVLFNHSVSDVEGDSLNFSLGNCFQSVGTTVV